MANPSLNARHATSPGAWLRKNTFLRFFLFSQAVYLLFYAVEPLRAWLGDTRTTTAADSKLFIFTVILLLANFAAYLIAAGKIDFSSPRTVKKILLGAAVACFTLAFVWPVGSNDIFSYIYQARVLTEYGANPYLVPYDSFPLDSFRAFTAGNRWAALTTPYGPLFVMAGAALSWAGGNSPLLALLLFKLFFAAVHGVNCFLVHKIFGNAKALFLYAANPLILFEFSLNGHNDVLVCFFILLAAGFVVKGWAGRAGQYWSVFFLALSVLIKFITAIFIPVYLLVLFFVQKTRRHKITFLAVSILIILAATTVSFLPLWGGGGTTTRAILQAQGGIEFSPYFPSPLPILFSTALLYAGIHDYIQQGVMAGRAIFLLLYVAIFFNAFWHRREMSITSLAKYLFYSLLVFYACFFFFLPPWYLTTLILLGLICFSLTGEKKYAGYIHVITFYGIIQYLLLR